MTGRVVTQVTGRDVQTIGPANVVVRLLSSASAMGQPSQLASRVDL